MPSAAAERKSSWKSPLKKCKSGMRFAGLVEVVNLLGFQGLIEQQELIHSAVQIADPIGMAGPRGPPVADRGRAELDRMRIANLMRAKGPTVDIVRGRQLRTVVHRGQVSPLSEVSWSHDRRRGEHIVLADKRHHGQVE